MFGTRDPGCIGVTEDRRVSSVLEDQEVPSSPDRPRDPWEELKSSGRLLFRVAEESFRCSAKYLNFDEYSPDGLRSHA
ncbi:hypothetical protein F2Q70_00045096 [Brassica cretica]|uniref:Uncharacterized protein n=1 Tax=Brassica cretica TaxID=69181 RepID=A0A8S9KJQ3_BRACR|nr:hypothetical protein F2Q70_00045096 [Brassica cretica]